VQPSPTEKKTAKKGLKCRPQTIGPKCSLRIHRPQVQPQNPSAPSAASESIGPKPRPVPKIVYRNLIGETRNRPKLKKNTNGWRGSAVVRWASWPKTQQPKTPTRHHKERVQVGEWSV